MHDEAARLLLGMFAATGIMISLSVISGIAFALIHNDLDLSQFQVVGLVGWFITASVSSYVAIEGIVPMETVLGGILVLFGISGTAAAAGTGMLLGNAVGRYVR